MVGLMQWLLLNRLRGVMSRKLLAKAEVELSKMSLVNSEPTLGLFRIVSRTHGEIF